MPNPALPSAQLLSLQSQWLAPARSRLLRKAGIGRRRHVLDLGCGRGDVTAELARRCAGNVVGLDLCLDHVPNSPDVSLAVGDACRLPFADGAFDMVFCQFVFLWSDAAYVADEAFRVLTPGGVLVAIEPDYGGMIEYPAELAVRDLWLDALTSAGANPIVGRTLPPLLHAAGFRVEVELLDRLAPPAAERFKYLEEMDLNTHVRQRLAAAERADREISANAKVAHLPLFLTTAFRP